MIRMLVVALTVVCLFLTGCSQEQPTAPTQPKTETKPAVAPPSPAIPSPAVAPAAPPAPQETGKAATPVVAEAAKSAVVPPAATPAPAPVEAKPAAASPAAKPIDVVTTVTLAASQGQVTLPHLAHAKLFPCATCHGDGTPGKIDLTKETAHELCRDCHKAKGKGPTACGDCHKK